MRRASDRRPVSALRPEGQLDIPGALAAPGSPGAGSALPGAVSASPGLAGPELTGNTTSGSVPSNPDALTVHRRRLVACAAVSHACHGAQSGGGSTSDRAADRPEAAGSPTNDSTPSAAPASASSTAFVRAPLGARCSDTTRWSRALVVAT